MRTRSALQRRPRTALAVIALVLAVSPVVAGCQGSQGSKPVPASFTPSPCPPGWHEAGDGGCLITGTRLPVPVQLPSPDGTPGARLDACARPAS